MKKVAEPAQVAGSAHYQAIGILSQRKGSIYGYY